MITKRVLKKWCEDNEVDYTDEFHSIASSFFVRFNDFKVDHPSIFDDRQDMRQYFMDIDSEVYSRYDSFQDYLEERAYTNGWEVFHSNKYVVFAP